MKRGGGRGWGFRFKSGGATGLIPDTLDRVDGGHYSCFVSAVSPRRARADHAPDSDADIAVILRGARGDRYKVSGELAAIEFHVLMETGVMVQGLPLWEDELARPETFPNPALIANILREGVHL